MSNAWSSGSDTRWTTFRRALFAAWDLQGRTGCELQEDGCTGRREQVDHRQPLSRGGAKYDPANCRPACEHCNRKLGDRTPVPQPAPRPHSNW